MVTAYFKTFISAARLLTRKERKNGLLLVFTMILSAFLEMLAVSSIVPFLSLVTSPSYIEKSKFISTAYDLSKKMGIENYSQFLVLLGIITISITLISALYRSFVQFRSNQFVENLRHTLSLRLITKYLSMQYAFFMRRNSGDIAKNILSEIDQLVLNIYRPFASIVSNLFILLFIFIFLLLIDPKITLITVFVLFILYLTVFSIISKKLKFLGKERLKQNSSRYQIVNEILSCIKICKLFALETTFTNRFTVPSLSIANNQVVYQTLSQVPNYFIQGLITSIVVLLTLFFASDSNSGKTINFESFVPSLALFLLAFNRIKPGIQNIFQSFSCLKYGSEVLNNIKKEMLQESCKESSFCSKKISFSSFIHLRNIHFTYPDSKNIIINNIDLKIKKGSKIGIVGSSGSGKTTLVDIMLGLLSTDIGNIIVDNIEISSKNIKSWQNIVGYVPQDIFLLDSSIASNVSLCEETNDIDYRKVEYCCKQVQLHKHITSNLPDGYDSMVGEGAIRLSGGQRQRLSIARALYREPEILILDEATSALDTKTERDLMKCLFSFSSKKTLIIIAHRLSTLSDCDEIITIDNGIVSHRTSN